MKGLLNNIGIIVLLIGVLVLVIPYLTSGMSNKMLAIGLILVILGFLLHIILGRFSKQ